MLETTDPDPRPCTKCGVIKPITEFHCEKEGRNGRRSRCKDCENPGETVTATTLPSKAIDPTPPPGRKDAAAAVKKNRSRNIMWTDTRKSALETIVTSVPLR